MVDTIADYSSGESDCEKPVVPQCNLCTEPFKYKCPKCLTLSCSLKCVNLHKTQTGCDGQKPPYEHRALPMKDMNVEVLRKDMRMLEKGINMSNRAKRDNLITAKVEID